MADALRQRDSDAQLRRRLAEVGAPIVVASFPRSGTHLAIDGLRRHVPACSSWKYFGERTDHLYLSLESLLEAGRGYHTRAVLKRIRRSQRPVIKTHAFPSFEPWRERHGPWVEWIRARGGFIYAYRDGRASACSLYLGRAGMFPGSGPMSMGEFLRREWDGMSLPRRWAAHVEQWLAVSDVIPVRYEQLFGQLRQVIERAAEAFGLTPRFLEPLLPAPTRSRWHGRWVRLTSRCPQSTALVHGRLRCRRTPKWSDVFTPDDRRFFHEEAGDMLTRLEIERSDAWVETGRPTVPS